ncbi:hypothetical protein COO60DRAFT_627274 [Scenedesmus sp. NREL 46B-D3]|nr:hypothetical protein COO60DRAFT_627274 [Scenedesmus sp. NREL 46B-D3]
MIANNQKRCQCAGNKGSSRPALRLVSHFRPHCKAGQLLARAAADDNIERDALDEPFFKSKDMGVVFSQQHSDVADPVQFPVTVPLLPFAVEEVFLPGSVKTLHLYEARYLAMLEEVLSNPGRNKFIGHVVVEQLGDPVGSRAAAFPHAFVGDNFIMLMGTLCRVLEVKSLRVGAFVKVQAECRVAVTRVTKVQPFVLGSVEAVQDVPLQDMQLVQQQVQQLQTTMQDLQNLSMKFRSKHTAALQHAMYWWPKAPLVPAASAAAAETLSSTTTGSGSSSSSNSDIFAVLEQDATSTSGAADASIGTSSSLDRSGSGSSQTAGSAETAARLSFAALQLVPEASPKEQLKLLRCRVNALETDDTSARLAMAQEHMQESLQLLAAKCALKSLQLS